MHAYGERGGRSVAVRGNGRCHPKDRDAFAYIEFALDEIACNVGARAGDGASGLAGRGPSAL